MHLSNYMPKLYKKNIEMNNIIDSEEVEDENIKTNIENSFNNTFIERANETGIRMFEKILNLPIDNSIALENRRQRAKNRISLAPPFTERYFKKYLDNILGEGSWSYTIDYDDLELSISILKPGDFWYKELMNFLYDVLPCNIDWEVIAYSVGWSYVQQSFPTWNDILNANMSWQDVLDGDY